MSHRTPMSSRKLIGFWLAAVVLGWLGVELLVVAGLWLRPRDDVDVQFLYQAHPYRAFAPVPGVASSDGKRSFNSLGLRGRESTVAKPPKTVRIVCLGGSTTYSSRATTDSHTYPARTEALLREHYGDAPFRIEVLNAGVEAYTSLESLIYFETRLLDLAPDVVILQHGINDGWIMTAFPGFQGDYSHARATFRVPPLRWWEHSPSLSYVFRRRVSVTNPYFAPRNVNLGVLIVKRRAVFWDSTLVIEEGRSDPRNQVVLARNIRSFVAVARGHGVIPVLSTQSVRRTPVGDWFNRASRSVARSESVALIDFAGLMPWDDDNFYDACHLEDTPEGLGRKARIFADHLIQHRLVERAFQKQRREADPN